MKEAEILANEAAHFNEPEGQRTIHLYRQGKFLRAYNFSAFLLNRYSPAEIKTTNVPTKQGPKVFAGFPEDSRDKFVGISGAIATSTVPDRVDVLLPQNLLNQNEDISIVMTDYENWLRCVPSPERKSTIELPTGTLLSAINEIIHYPVEQKSLLDNTSFLIDIRQKLIRLI